MPAFALWSKEAFADYESRNTITDCVANPPRHYGPWERVVSLLAEDWSKRMSM